MRLWWLLVLVAPMAAPLGAAQAATPEQVHVGLTAEGTGLVVQWAVLGTEYGASEAPVVEWTLAGATKSVPARLVGSHAYLGPTPERPVPEAVTYYGPTAYIYAATVGPVPPGAEVIYRVGSGGRGFAGPFTIKAPPGPNETLRFAAVADIGGDGVARDGTQVPNAASAPIAVRDRLLALKPDLVIMPGDLAYDNSVPGQDKWFRLYQPVMSRIPTMPVVGNHEYNKTRGGYVPFEQRFVLPGDEHDFVFRAGPVLFLAMDANRVCSGVNRALTGTPLEPCKGDKGPMRSESVEFLRSQLTAARASGAAWVIPYFHQPVHSNGAHGSDRALQAYWAPVLEGFRVPLVINGHDHMYVRSHQMRSGNATDTDGDFVSSGGTVYLVTGGGGRRLYDFPASAANATWVAKYEKQHHVSMLTVNATTLTFQAVKPDGSVFDTFSIRLASGEAVPAAPPASTSAPSWFVLVAIVALAAWLRRAAN